MRIILNEAKGSAMDFYLQRLQEALTAATRGMTVEDLTRHPEGKWNTAEVLEHLYLTYTGTVKGFRALPESGKTHSDFAHTETAAGHYIRDQVRPYAWRTEGAEQYASARSTGRESDDRYWAPDRGHGRPHWALRRALRSTDQVAGPSDPGTAD